MFDQLLSTKLFPPPPGPSRVARADLIRRLHDGMKTRFTLVSAPAGFGKTTLVSEWIAHADRPAAWVSLDPGDNDAAAFFAYVAASLDRIDPRIGVAVRALLRSGPSPEPAALATALINGITAAETPLVLVLDDFHCLEADSVLAAVNMLVDRQPSLMHLVAICRHDPLLPLARMRGRGWMHEIRTRDLRFTTDEVAEFLNGKRQLGLSRGELSALADRTEGWPAGLQMAALSLQGYARGRARSDFISGFAGDDRHVMDYLLSEVLSQQSEGVRQFLLKTAILDRFCAPLCEAVLRDAPVAGLPADSEDVLEMLDRRNLFLISLDDRREWYRYHHLFVALLRNRLSRTLPDVIPRLYERASRWFEKKGLREEAAHYALMAGDRERAARLAATAVMRLVGEARLRDVLRWLEVLPRDIVVAQPLLRQACAWACLLSGRVEDARTLVSSPEPDRPTAGGAQAGPGHDDAIRAFIARYRGDLAGSIRISRRALAELPVGAVMVRSAIALNLGNAYWASGGVVEAAEHYEMAAGAGEDSAYVTLTALSNLAAVEETRGRLDRAAQISRRAMALGEEWGGGQALPAAGRAYIGLGRVLYLQNDLSGAETEVEHGVRMGQQAGDTFMEFEGRRELARLRRAQGRQDALEELLNWTRENAQRLGRVTETAEIDALRAELLLARSDLLAAARWISERKGLMAGDLPFSGYPRQLVMARVLYALEREAEALQLLGRMRQEAESRGRAGHVIAILGLEALCQRRTRLVEDSLRSLERALRLAEAENHVRLFIDHGPPMIALLEEAAERKIMRAYCEKLVAAFRVDALPACGGSDARLVGPLSRREIEVLRMLAGQLSGPEIAEKLFVALSTLRTHTKTIYAKLAVGSRRAAVHRARELRLL